jgi:hypothetical protein
MDSVGMMNVVIPLFQAEMAPANNRGKMVGFHGALIVAGYVSIITTSQYDHSNWHSLSLLLDGPA